jgi:hypothetical protein
MAPTKIKLTKAQRAYYDKVSLIHATFERTTKEISKVMSERRAVA